MVFLDGTSIRAHAIAAGASKEGDLEEAVIAVEHLAEAVEVSARKSS